MTGHGLRILLMRRLIGIGQDELAARAGVAASTVGRLERAETEARPSTVRRLETALVNLHAERVLGAPNCEAACAAE